MKKVTDMTYPTAATASLLCLLFTLTALPSVTARASQAELLQQLEMMEQMDELDRQEFNQLLQQADQCAEQLDFVCARQRMNDASPLMLDPDMEQRYQASQSYYQTMQGYAAGLIQDSIDYRPLAQFKEICPDPFADYSRYEAEGNDFHSVSSRWIKRRSQHEEFIACKETFSRSYDIDGWTAALAEKQTLEKSLDNRSKSGIHNLSRQSEIRKIHAYIDEEGDSYQEVMNDYAEQLSFLARRDSSSSSSGDWMDSLAVGLQNLNQQLQNNNQQIQNNINQIHQQVARENQQRRQQNQEAIAAKARQQRQQQKLLAEQKRQLQLQHERQKQIAANSKPTTLYTRGPDQHRTIGNATGSVNLGGGPQNTQTGAVRFDYQGSRPDQQNSANGSPVSASARPGNTPSSVLASAGNTPSPGNSSPGLPSSGSNTPGSSDTASALIEQHVWKAYSAEKQSEGLLTTKENTMYEMTGTVRFVHTFYRKSYTDRCTIDYGTLLLVDWEYHGKKALQFREYFVSHGDALDAWFEHKNGTSRYKDYSQNYEDIERALRHEDCQSVARGKWVNY